MADGVAMQPVRRSKSLPCDRKRKVAPSLGPATRTAARSKCLLLAVESGGGSIASGKTALKALLLLLMHTHHAHRTTTWTETINCTFADEQLDFSIGSLAENVEYFPLYCKVLYPFSPR